MENGVGASPLNLWLLEHHSEKKRPPFQRRLQAVGQIYELSLSPRNVRRDVVLRMSGFVTIAVSSIVRRDDFRYLIFSRVIALTRSFSAFSRTSCAPPAENLRP